MKLCIGLLAASPQWEQLLLQEGVSWNHANLLADDLNSAFSALVINRELSREEAEAVQSYLRGGGGILGYAGHLAGIGVRSRLAPIQYLVGDSDPHFDIHILDAAVEGSIANEATMMRTQNNEFAVFAGELGGGVGVILPVDVERLMDGERSVVKNFYSYRERLPAEHVSLVSKGEVRHLVVQGLRYLHQARSMLYAHLWYFPDGHRNVFAFRIDTDAGIREDIDRLYSLARGYDIRMTWFLDVQSHEGWLHHFSSMAAQEMGVHCYEHRVFGQTGLNDANFQKARRLMESIGLLPAGLAMPFGSWNHDIAGTIDRLGMSYSSEFSFAYDTLPSYPVVHGRKVNTVQIPIHPICVGSLRRVAYSETMMREYLFMKVVEKLGREEPLFFYHHPSDQNTSVVESLFEQVRGEKISNTTFTEYASWWKIREEVLPRFEENGNTLHTGVKRDHASVFMRLLKDGKEAIVPFSATLDMAKMDWRDSAAFSILPRDIRRIREFDTRALVSKLYTKFQRKFR